MNNNNANIPKIMLTKNDFPYIKVRPITEDEVARWDSLMNEFHYLGFRRLVGETIKYVAIFHKQWVALIGWGSAAFKISSRDLWVGWTKEQQFSRLKFIANNQRFLILPEFTIKNLASKIMSLNLKRLSQDWKYIYDHPIMVAETFIDHQRFTGACYQASNWIKLGQTQGFGRNGGKYFPHGHSKTVYVYPLHSQAVPLLSASFLPPTLAEKHQSILDLNQVSIKGDQGLLDFLTKLIDPRKARGIRHSFISVLAIGVCAKLSGNSSFVAMREWAINLPQSLLKKFGCRFDENKKVFIVPSEPTIRRTLQSVDVDELECLIREWLTKQRVDKRILYTKFPLIREKD